MDTKQPEALRIAEWLEGIRGNTWPSYIPQEAAAELRRQHAEIETLRAGYDAARLEIASLRERVQQLGQLARDVNSRRVTELEAQLAAVGAGGVGKLAVAHPTQDRAVERDELLQAAINFIQTLTGMTPPPIEVAPPEVFAPFRAFVEKIQEITDRRCAASVEPLRKRCLHQISEPAKAGWCDGCSPDNCGGCVNSAAPAQAGEQNHLPLAITSAPERIWLDLGFNPYEDDVHFSHLHDLTWSQNNATGGGIEYVRADLAARGAAQAAPVDAENEIDLFVEVGLCERLDACLAAARAAQGGAA